MTATPNIMPRKVNPIHQKILGALIETTQVTSVYKSVDPASENPRRPNIIETKKTRPLLRYALAQNVSEFNVDLAARRWFK
ncbi:hypothetical protein SHEEN_65 [Mycobacterium phage Sheen]|uniref:Uncharacterized protein n=1 Tax=Mycobacterium phage Sheen TaxID=1589274 RepID=A0A0B5A0X7_9CAUD|nr:hypothetical protein AVV31_gp29 [Mycobacterium phage Sheen]AJD82483.1 hypothetical protein SHEEN_65 [Mycobacterium phage Sheen]